MPRQPHQTLISTKSPCSPSSSTHPSRQHGTVSTIYAHHPLPLTISSHHIRISSHPHDDILVYLSIISVIIPTYLYLQLTPTSLLSCIAHRLTSCHTCPHKLHRFFSNNCFAPPACTPPVPPLCGTPPVVLTTPHATKLCRGVTMVLTHHRHRRHRGLGRGARLTTLRARRNARTDAARLRQCRWTMRSSHGGPLRRNGHNGVRTMRSVSKSPLFNF